MLRLFLYLLILIAQGSLYAQQQIYAAGKAPVQIIDNNFLALLSLKFVQQVCSQETISPAVVAIKNASFKYIDYQFAHCLMRAKAEDFKHQIELRRTVLASDPVREQKAIEKLGAEIAVENKAGMQKELMWHFSKSRCKRLIYQTRFIALTVLLVVAYLVSQKIPQNSSLYPVESKFEWWATWLSPYVINFTVNSILSANIPSLSDPAQAKLHPYQTLAKRASISFLISFIQYLTYVQISSYFHPYIMPTQQEYLRDFTQNMLCSNLVSIL